MFSLNKYKKNRILPFLMTAVLAAGLFSGCGKKTTANTEYFYYLDQQGISVVKEVYDYTSSKDNMEERIQEVVQELSAETNNVDYQAPLPSGVSLNGYTVENGTLILQLSKEYNDLSPEQEILRRGAIVLDFVQIDGIAGVEFMINNEPLTDAAGNEVGVMDGNDFAQNPASDINNIKSKQLTLYFADESGTGLVKETRKVYYYTGYSAEKLIMEQLLKGPQSQNAQAAIPENTGLVSVSVMDGVCIVSLDSQFLTQNYGIQTEIVIYSIVDSLTQLSDVNTVQISVEGKTDIMYRDEIPLSESYTANYDFDIENGDTSATVYQDAVDEQIVTDEEEKGAEK